MPTRSAAECPACSASNPDGSLLPGSLWTIRLWTIRLAGARSARPALELYEGGVLLDVVSSTPVAPQLVRGARTAMDCDQPRTLAWGRMPPTGDCPAVDFTRGRGRSRRAVVMRVTNWCWVAVADGSFGHAVVGTAGGSARFRVSSGRPWR